MTRLRIISVARKVPAWVKAGYEEYEKRLPPDFNLKLVEIAPARRSNNVPASRILKQEAEAILKDIPEGYRVIVLDERGRQQKTLEFSGELRRWIDSGINACFIIGGADGVDGSVIDAADERWSLSMYTLPHALVRVVLIEQVYRACCILTNHPYHRE